MERQLSALGYWLDLICKILALIFRLLSALSITLHRMGPPGGNAIS